jgi:hypothetical protein
MPKLNVEVPHSLPQDEATRRLKDSFTSVRDTYQSHLSDFQEKWGDHQLDFSLTTFGMTISGNVVSAPSSVNVVADLPMMALMFKGKIEERIREHLSQLLV